MEVLCSACKALCTVLYKTQPPANYQVRWSVLQGALQVIISTLWAVPLPAWFEFKYHAGKKGSPDLIMMPGVLTGWWSCLLGWSFIVPLVISGKAF